MVFLNQFPVDFFSSLIKHSDSTFINIFYVCLAALIIAIGCNIMINSKLGMGIYDAFIFSFTNKYGWDFVHVRYVVDAVFLLLTFVFDGFIGIGTILAYLLTGNLMKLTKPVIDKFVKCED